MIFHHTTHGKLVTCLFATLSLAASLQAGAANTSPGAQALREGLAAYQKGTTAWLKASFGKAIDRG
jgi:hypothetical protein